MGQTETDEIAGELYLVPPAQFVAVRDELVRKARAAGQRDLARELASLRRPAASAWLVNMLTRHERSGVERLFALGRDLRRAQTQLDAAELRRLSTLRKGLTAGLLDRARRLAADAGFPATEAVLSEVEATLHAALVDLAGSFTVLSGRLTKPMSYQGFGPMPQVSLPPDTPPELPTEAAPPEPEPAPQVAPWPAVGEPDPPVPAPAPGEWTLRLVGDERGLRRERTASGREGAERDDRVPPLQRAEADLAAAESAHWQREHDLADAEAALQAAQDRLDWLDSQRMEARREKVTAEQRLATAQEAQRVAVRAVAAARRALDAAEGGEPRPDREPPSRSGEF